jgi:hypothetical protein
VNLGHLVGDVVATKRPKPAYQTPRQRRRAGIVFRCVDVVAPLGTATRSSSLLACAIKVNHRFISSCPEGMNGFNIPDICSRQDNCS